MQNTIKGEILISGTGLHTGEIAKVFLKPAPPDTGIVFIKDNVKIEALLPYVSSSYRNISLEKDGVCIKTIEHLLAALSSFSITNLFIEVIGSEVPIMDGSSFPFVEAIKKVGLKPQDKEIKSISVLSHLSISEDGRSIAAFPYNGLKVSYIISFNNPIIKNQSFTITLNEERFINEISKARTFGFMDEVPSLREIGLIKGGSLENAIVVGKDKIINKEPLRYPDEFVRHKILDLLGDISLLGVKLNSHIIANCSSHSLNIKFLKKIEEIYKKGDGYNRDFSDNST